SFAPLLYTRAFDVFQYRHRRAAVVVFEPIKFGDESLSRGQAESLYFSFFWDRVPVRRLFERDSERLRQMERQHASIRRLLRILDSSPRCQRNNGDGVQYALRWRAIK